MTGVTCLRHQLGFFFVETKTLLFASNILNMKQMSGLTSGSRSRVTAPRHVELGLGRGLLAIPGMGELGTDGNFYLFSCWWYPQSIMWPTLCPSFQVSGSTEYQTCIQHSGLKLPIKVLIPLLTPVLILPGCPSRNCSEELMMTWIQRLEA